PGHDGPLLEYSYVVVVQRLRIEPAQPRHLGQHVVPQRRPIEPGAFHMPTEALCIYEIFRNVRAVHHQLLRHTTPNYTGTADAMLFGDGHFGAMRRRHSRRAHTAGPGANYQEIVVTLAGHVRRIPEALPKPAVYYERAPSFRRSTIATEFDTGSNMICASPRSSCCITCASFSSRVYSR